MNLYICVYVVGFWNTQPFDKCTGREKLYVAPLPLAGQSPLPPAHHGEVEVGFWAGYMNISSFIN